MKGSLTVSEDDLADTDVLATTRLVFVSGGPVHGVANGVIGVRLPQGHHVRSSPQDRDRRGDRASLGI